MEFIRQRINTSRLPSSVTSKWRGVALEEGFVPFPKRLLRCLRDLFPGPQGMTELAATLAIVDFRRPNLTRDPSPSYLAFIAGMSEGAFMEALDSLGKRDLIKVEETDTGISVDIEPLIARVEELTPRGDQE